MHRWLTRILQGTFVLVCLVVVVDGRHPPLQAQAMTADEREQIREDATQDGSLRELKANQDRMDARMSKMWDTMNANSNAISSMTTEIRGIGGGLALLQSGIFVIGRRKRVGETEE